MALHEETLVCLCVGGLLRTAGILTQEVMSEAREVCRWIIYLTVSQRADFSQHAWIGMDSDCLNILQNRMNCNVKQPLALITIFPIYTSERK